MKILLIGFSKIKFMPYVNFYLDHIDKDKHDVHLLYWNRDLKYEETSCYSNITLHEFRCYQEDNVPPIVKVGSFLKYYKFTQKLLREHRFDFAIILHSMPGILLYHTWLKKFNGKYIFDYRDSTYERFSFYKRMIARLIRKSMVSFTSSDGFRVFFPDSQQHKVYTSHNILTDSLSHRHMEKTVYDRIRVAFWGFMREETINREIIHKFAADQRFELHYYGREQRVAQNLKAYVKELQAPNVFFHGEYSPQDRYEFAKNTDLIHNIYCDDNMMLAMSNKYYDGAIFYLPQLCMKDSFMGRQVQEKEIGLACDPNETDFTQTVYAYYAQLNREDFVQNCDSELARVMGQYQEGAAMLQRLFG